MGILDGVSTAVRRQFDDTPGGGVIEWSNQDRDRYERDTNGADTFGDGSNRWIPGTVETLRGEGKQDVAGVFDALALNFDEGIGGLSTLVDNRAGNTAGPGQSPVLENPREGQPENPGTTGSPILDKLFKGALAFGAVYAGVTLLPPVLELVANLSGAFGDG